MKQGAVMLRGMVVHGDGYGRKIGFPTANLSRHGWARLQRKPRLGVWAGWVMLEGRPQKHRAGIVIGPRDRRGLPKLEAHLLDFSGDLYGRQLTFCLAAFLRPFRKYAHEADLMRAIQEDINTVRKANI
jgi:riboflavin kinase/FMN adenylyltransferase